MIPKSKRFLYVYNAFYRKIIHLDTFLIFRYFFAQNKYFALNNGYLADVQTTTPLLYYVRKAIRLPLLK
ncbi:hypothetical protein SD10_12905 [Spirosoma radiotolerans]|uniref:Uncharacterized protein n=1 Tax=Spirosoma radiotolerans TaxID=1379870 RepID=A0A0E3ZUP6_9BACT|nr:hypothetical protein SD10_12905 [Spirosoma radiotolerans]